MYALAGLMVVASLTHASVKFPYIPLSERSHETVNVEGKEKST